MSTDNIFTFVSCIITFVLSILASWIINFFHTQRQKKENQYTFLYKPFFILFNKIHRGCAFDFSDLSEEQKKEIVDFLNNNSVYLDKELQDAFYQLQVNYNDSSSDNEESAKVCDEMYIKIFTKIIEKESKLRKKYI